MTDKQKILELLIHVDKVNNDLGVQLLIGSGLKHHELIDDDAEFSYIQTSRLFNVLGYKQLSEILRKVINFDLETVPGKSINNYIKDYNKTSNNDKHM